MLTILPHFPTTFSNYSSNVPIADDEIMLSPDITSLYRNIPVIDILHITKDYVNNDIILPVKQLYLKTSFLIQLI